MQPPGPESEERDEQDNDCITHGCKRKKSDVTVTEENRYPFFAPKVLFPSKNSTKCNLVAFSRSHCRHIRRDKNAM